MKNYKVLRKDDVKSSSDELMMIAGPCSVENYEVMDQTAAFLKKIGVKYLRGGAFKPRTSPYSFQGLGDMGLEIFSDIKQKYGLKIVTELLDIRDMDELLKVADVIQVGSRNMYNYPLLREVGKTNKTVLLKRGMSATIEEWVNAAEYIAIEGNTDIILCERGIRTYETYTRNTLDLSCVPVIKEKTGLKILVDPSHGTGMRSLVKPMSMAAVAAGCDGLIIEIHPEPDKALSDSQQTIDFNLFEDIYNDSLKLNKMLKK